MKRTLLFAAIALIGPAFPQLLAPNDAGVTMGHLHFRTPDVATHARLWTGILGGKPLELGRMHAAKLPGVLVLWEPGDSKAGTVGSVVNHLGFKVRDLSQTLARTEEAGIRTESRGAANAFIVMPDGVRIELMEDKALATTAAHHHIHFFDEHVKETQAWYVKTFGAIPGRRADFDAADLPGVNLTFALAKDGPTAGTKGRVLDHIGFEVKNLEAFTKKLEAAGVKFDVPYRSIPSLGLSLAFFTDPFGTYIELTEGLDRL